MPNEFTLATLRGHNQSFEEFMLDVIRDTPAFKGMNSPLPETIQPTTFHLYEQDRISEELRTVLMYTDAEWEEMALAEYDKAEGARLEAHKLAAEGRERISARTEEVMDWEVPYGPLRDLRERALRLLRDSFMECDVEAYETPTRRMSGQEVKQRDLTILMQQYLDAGKQHNKAIDEAERKTNALHELRASLREYAMESANA